MAQTTEGLEKMQGAPPPKIRFSRKSKGLLQGFALRDLNLLSHRRIQFALKGWQFAEVFHLVRFPLRFQQASRPVSSALASAWPVIA
jgi:hypothetical protein